MRFLRLQGGRHPSGGAKVAATDRAGIAQEECTVKGSSSERLGSQGVGKGTPDKGSGVLGAGGNTREKLRC